MATFVIVHGAWGGGWEWTPVARLLRKRGHDVFTPTLTGMGERERLGTEIDLSDHIEDVLAVFTFEALRDVVLCGHSYGGMVVTGVADRIPEAVRLLVYLDAFVPRDGESVETLASPPFRELVRQVAVEGPDARFAFPEEVAPPEGLIPEAALASYVARTRPHPVTTLTQPIRLTGAVERLRRAFVRCTGGERAEPEEEMTPFASRARSEGWTYRETPTPHDLQLFDPDATVALLHELATA